MISPQESLKHGLANNCKIQPEWTRSCAKRGGTIWTLPLGCRIFTNVAMETPDQRSGNSGDDRSSDVATNKASATSTSHSSYPGASASVGNLISLADAYWGAAHGLLHQIELDRPVTSAPARLCAIHAIETYLSAFLVFHSMDRKQVRGLQHDLARRVEMAVDNGLLLNAETREQLAHLNVHREYIVVRYGPEQLHDLSELDRLFSTLKEVSAEVRKTILQQPYDQSDPKFRKYW